MLVNAPFSSELMVCGVEPDVDDPELELVELSLLRDG
jgi:hypothetical protein